MRAILAVLTLAAVPGFAAQDVPMMSGLDPFNVQMGSSLADALSGKTTPLQRTLKDFDETWRRFTVPNTGDAPMNYLTLLTGAMGSGLTSPSPYYTRGETVIVGSETFLIAYRQQLKGLDFPTLMRADRSNQPPPKPEPLTLDRPLFMCLLNVRTLGSLNEIRPVVAAQEVEESRAAIDTAWGAIAEMSAPTRAGSAAALGGTRAAPKPPPKK